MITTNLLTIKTNYMNFFILFLLCTIFNNLLQSQWSSWKPAPNGSLPTNAFIGGNDGRHLYIGRANYEGGLHIGKYHTGDNFALISWGGKEIFVSNNVEVFVDKGLWVNVTNNLIPPNVFWEGFEGSDRTNLCIARANINGQWHPGKAATHVTYGNGNGGTYISRAWIPYGGEERNFTNGGFQVLTYPTFPSGAFTIKYNNSNKYLVIDGNDPATDRYILWDNVGQTDIIWVSDGAGRIHNLGTSNYLGIRDTTGCILKQACGGHSQDIIPIWRKSTTSNSNFKFLLSNTNKYLFAENQGYSNGSRVLVGSIPQNNVNWSIQPVSITKIDFEIRTGQDDQREVAFLKMGNTEIELGRGFSPWTTYNGSKNVNLPLKCNNILLRHDGTPHGFGVNTYDNWDFLEIKVTATLSTGAKIILINYNRPFRFTGDNRILPLENSSGICLGCYIPG